MRRIATFVLLVGVGVLPLAAVPGCSNNKETDAYERMLARRRQLATSREEEEPKTALQAQGLDGVLCGKVVYDGEPPIPGPLRNVEYHEDKEHCLKGSFTETHWPRWIVNKETKAVASVVVWLEPPAEKYYSLTEEVRNRQGEVVVIDQPYCAFVPHVVSLFPSYFDGTKEVKTGQKLEVRNSAPILHAIQWNPTLWNPSRNQNIPPKSKWEVVLNPQPIPLYIGCGVHHFMHGIIWIFDHPYHAVTKEDGTFQIKNIPTGVELTFKAWHESRRDPFEEKKMIFRKGENPPLELKIKQ